MRAVGPMLRPAHGTGSLSMAASVADRSGWRCWSLPRRDHSGTAAREKQHEQVRRISDRDLAEPIGLVKLDPRTGAVP